MAITVVSWNIARRHEPWRQLLQMDADVALLQEAAPPPDDVVRLRDATLPPAEDASPLDIGPRASWDSHSWTETHGRAQKGRHCTTAGRWSCASRTGSKSIGSSRSVRYSDWWHGRGTALYDRWPMVVRLSDRVEVDWFKQVGPVDWTALDEIAVSGIGTIAAARITPRDGSTDPFVAVSMYGRWMAPHPSKDRPSWIYSDSSVHRIISDLSTFISSTDPSTHRILAAGDLNMIYGATDDNRLSLPARDRTVTDRMDALGMEFLGPQYPAGRRACPSPQGLPPDTRNVPTYYTTTQSPATAQNQLDYVFASRGFHESVEVRALNGVEEWGASDHCRLLINVADG